MSHALTFLLADSTDRPLPPHLKEISSLASWTVSTHKPGNGVAALRHPSTAHFWQSDGPQPHTLNIHFFKLVAIAHLRIFIDFSLDESYTPIKLELLAGTGHHDLQLVQELAPKDPKGWLDIDLSKAGGPPALRPDEAVDDGSDDAAYDQFSMSPPSPDDDMSPEDLAMHCHTQLAARRARRRWRRLGTGPTLRCFLVQLRILENHQNGKDTHLRGLQIFARDEDYIFARRPPSPPQQSATTTHEVKKFSMPPYEPEMTRPRVTEQFSVVRSTRMPGPVQPAASAAVVEANDIPMIDAPVYTDAEGLAGHIFASSTGEQFSPVPARLTSEGAHGRGRVNRRANRVRAGNSREPDWLGELETRLGVHEYGGHELP